MLGHDGPPTAFWNANLITDEPLPECPVRVLQRARETDASLVEELDRYLEVYYPAFEKGHLLAAGGVDDQPARYWDLITLIRDTAAQQQAKYDALTADLED